MVPPSLRGRARFAGSCCQPFVEVVEAIANAAPHLDEGEGIAPGAAPNLQSAGAKGQVFGGLLFVKQNSFFAPFVLGGLGDIHVLLLVVSGGTIASRYG